ncbi:hypothetical protein SAMN02910298_01199 [Pseudobutyrivibrio sp. YE44]|uniref:hypothetical protein n=1 Tax=Pseudobutyrivibrio sp. YE44 TaxID=1520802 RepID=UPI0008853759|nr:hypothetical protein [Pseudobutyrivibrio sp. YE44]SDB24187.1 hypothetical protein SAMN02910298_01199 [Pseudobutyrivibrio sp. YE44]
MVINDIRFRTHLNYQIQAQSEALKEDKLDISEVQDIDLRRCYFADFKKAMEYIREHNPDYSFSDFTIEAVKPAPADFSEDKKYNFVELTDYAKHTAITIGNMALFSELQKISSAEEKFNYKVASHHEKKATIKSFEDYNNYTIKQQPNTFEELGSCVIGGGNLDPIKLTATFHESSTDNKPIISIRAFSLSNNTYLDNRDIVDLDSIYKPNASLMETFAYMSYADHKKNKFNYSFDKLLFSGSYEVDSLDDMYELHYDLKTFDYLNQN